MYGYIYASVVPDPRFTEEPGELDLFFNIKEGEQFRVGKINVHVDGEITHTRQDVILNRLAFTPGDLISSRKVRTAERLLKHSQLFINNPALGTPPRIVIQPPKMTPDVLRIARPPEGEMEEDEDPGTASPPNDDTVRGQSPSTTGNTIHRGSPWQPLEPFISRGNQ